MGLVWWWVRDSLPLLLLVVLLTSSATPTNSHFTHPNLDANNKDKDNSDNDRQWCHVGTTTLPRHNDTAKRQQQQGLQPSQLPIRRCLPSQTHCQVTFSPTLAKFNCAHNTHCPPSGNQSSPFNQRLPLPPPLGELLLIHCNMHC